MPDIADLAAEREAWQRGQALAAQAEKAPLPAADWERASAKWCEGANCGARIPDERRRAYPGVRLCVECQAMQERRERLRR